MATFSIRPALAVARGCGVYVLRGMFANRTMSTTTSKLPSLPLSIKPSFEELSLNRLSWDNLQLATRAIHRDGLVVVEDVIDHQIIDALNDKMIEDAKYLCSLGDKSPFNYNKGNIQQDPPLTSKHFNGSIFLNPLINQITSSVLGPRPRLAFISGNSAIPPAPGSEPERQPVHSDADFEHPSCAFALVINVPLITMTPKNGSTEVWLGSHRDTNFDDQEGKHGDRASGRIKKDLLEEREKVRPPSQPIVKKGSVIVRDLRLWHAGCPNFSQETRVMLAMIHFAPWYRNFMSVQFSETLRPKLEAVESELQIQAEFLSEKGIEETYLNRPFGNAYDFNQAEKLEEIFKL